MKRLTCVCVTLAMASLTMAASAWAETTRICVPEKPSKPVLSASAKNECPTKSTTKYKTEALPNPTELEALDRILPHVNYVESGVGGKPTIQFSGVNVQIVNGEGKTESINGEGNLVIGYDAAPGAQTGSHNLVMGTLETFTSFGGILSGNRNSITAEFASVLGGESNQATNTFALVSGGTENTASGREATVSGGIINTASGKEASVSGGIGNIAEGLGASVSGGRENVASGTLSSIFGGLRQHATQEFEAIP